MKPETNSLQSAGSALPESNHTVPLRAKRALSACVAATAIALASTTLSQAAVVFDNMTKFEANDPTAGGATSTSSTPNTFMGDPYVLTAGTTAITGFDIFPVNASGVNYTGIKINIYVWGSVNTSGTVNATTPAFGNLLASYTLTSTGAFDTGFYFPFEGSPVGSAPAITLTTPLAPLSDDSRQSCGLRVRVRRTLAETTLTSFG